MARALPIKIRLLITCKVLGLFAVCFLVVHLLLAPIWAYLHLRWSPHGRALFAAKGERVAYLGSGSPPIMVGSGLFLDLRSRVPGPLPTEESVTKPVEEFAVPTWYPRVQQGRLEQIELDWELIKFGVFVLRFELADEDGRGGGGSGTLTAFDFETMQPLQRAGKIGRFDPSGLFLSLVMIIPFMLVGRRMLFRAAREASPEPEDPPLREQDTGVL